ncbi:hypothetical protein [Nonomuraea rubra]|uniref:Uncharacterized protein n=2 Tax=Nonomuraea rubra TaxID=46180 RepID=A0A7X0NU00_9ACTN|nr:hypothetical protein [Nonomuraea rubra]MBB6549603.1 hypothetical protein [Nonomuraea rubra]
MWVPYLAVVLIGALVALAELVSRYRDDPAGALFSVPAILYLAVNAGGAAAALWMVVQFGWTFGATGDSVAFTQVLVAGFGSGALFRSSLFNVTAGDQVIGVGPSAVLTVILSATDRAVDRGRARLRSKDVHDIMSGYPFERGSDALLQYSMAALQNFTPAESKVIEDRIASLRSGREATLPDQVKSYVLGLSLQALIGVKVLRQLVDSLRPVFAEAPPAEQVLLEILRINGKCELRKLQARSGLQLFEFSRVLDGLVAAGQVVLDEVSGEEVASLPETGR